MFRCCDFMSERKLNINRNRVLGPRTVAVNSEKSESSFNSELTRWLNETLQEHNYSNIYIYNMY